ncbi:MAG: Retron-type RNA-directed polymerase [Labilithrix sp.]|nr:Retron-type RNA-directed polymerase [Labilithrix sp.]
MTVAQKNAIGGKGPWGDRVDEAGTREGMAAKSGPNNPGRRTTGDKVQRLQRRLWIAAKRSSGRRFHAFYSLLWRSDLLLEAWKRVKANRGAAGVDSVTLVAIEQNGVGSFLEAIASSLRAGTYRPSVVLRRYIPKADGKRRPLGIPTVRDRVVQMAARLLMEPVFEADFLPCSYGFRPKRSATMALEALRVRGAKGGHYVFDADIRDYFGSIDHEKLMKLVAKRISDQRVINCTPLRWSRAPAARCVASRESRPSRRPRRGAGRQGHRSHRREAGRLPCGARSAHEGRRAEREARGCGEGRRAAPDALQSPLVSLPGQRRDRPEKPRRQGPRSRGDRAGLLRLSVAVWTGTVDAVGRRAELNASRRVLCAKPQGESSPSDPVQ